MWSDPHVETLGGDSADFMPHEDPVHTLVAKAGDYKIQSYHCPVVQATCQPDYYPCGASAAVAYAGSHGFIDADGNFVTPPTTENAKAFEDAQTQGWWPEFSSTTDSETGVTSMNYVDLGAWLKWLVHGNGYTSTDIECDAAAQTCTLQKCEGWECTDYTMPCTEGGRGCQTAEDFTSEVASLGGKEVTVRKYAKKDQQNKKQKQENESKQKQIRKSFQKCVRTALARQARPKPVQRLSLIHI